jgi:hypothetical protein
VEQKRGRWSSILVVRQKTSAVPLSRENKNREFSFWPKTIGQLSQRILYVHFRKKSLTVLPTIPYCAHRQPWPWKSWRALSLRGSICKEFEMNGFAELTMEEMMAVDGGAMDWGMFAAGCGVVFFGASTVAGGIFLNLIPGIGQAGCAAAIALGGSIAAAGIGLITASGFQ